VAGRTRSLPGSSDRISAGVALISLPEDGVKAHEYRIHIYPRDLARTITAQWTIASDAAVSLPPEEEFATFLSEAYQASLLREEDRPVNCRLILIDPSELSDNTGPPYGLQVLHLVDERKLREHEIRRPSPSATFYRCRRTCRRRRYASPVSLSSCSGTPGMYDNGRVAGWKRPLRRQPKRKGHLLGRHVLLGRLAKTLKKRSSMLKRPSSL
jgi:hypothetical protein